MAVDTTQLIRGASGLLWALFGLVVVALLVRGVKHRVRAAGLATYALAFGGAFVVFNVLPPSEPATARVAVALHLALWTVATPALVVFAATLPRPPVRDVVVGLALASASFGVGLAAVVLRPDDIRSFAGVLGDHWEIYRIDNLLQRVGGGIAIYVAYVLARRAARAPGDGFPSALLAASLILYPATLVGESAIRLYAEPGNEWMFAVGVGVYLVLAIAWLRAIRGAGRGALAVALLLPALVLAGEVELLSAGRQTGFIGVVRIGMLVALSVAVLRHDLLGAKLGARTTRRGSAAVVALAAVFVVAQAALPFVSGSAGLALGGVVAAGLTLAAPTIQRAFDGRPLGAPAPAGADDARLATYREAIRYALRDGVMSRKEETHLAQLAQHLGIGAGDALRVRHEVEDEPK